MAMTDQAADALLAPAAPTEHEAAIDPAGERASWLQVSPLVLVLLAFFGLPMVVVLVVSFFDFDRTSIVPAFILDNYTDLFRSEVTLRLYVSSLKFAAIDIKDPYGTLMEKKGSTRDGGAIWDRMGNIACWNTVMDEDRYLTRRWNEFVSS